MEEPLELLYYVEGKRRLSTSDCFDCFYFSGIEHAFRLEKSKPAGSYVEGIPTAVYSSTRKPALAFDLCTCLDGKPRLDMRL